MPILIITLIFSITLPLGFILGSAVIIEIVSEIAQGFIDEELVKQAIFQYKNHIANCYPPLELV